jgi:hypothetical protein
MVSPEYRERMAEMRRQDEERAKQRAKELEEALAAARQKQPAPVPEAEAPFDHHAHLAKLEPKIRELRLRSGHVHKVVYDEGRYRLYVFDSFFTLDFATKERVVREVYDIVFDARPSGFMDVLSSFSGRTVAVYDGPATRLRVE